MQVDGYRITQVKEQLGRGVIDIHSITQVLEALTGEEKKRESPVSSGTFRDRVNYYRSHIKNTKP